MQGLSKAIEQLNTVHKKEEDKLKRKFKELTAAKGSNFNGKSKADIAKRQNDVGKEAVANYRSESRKMQKVLERGIEEESEKTDDEFDDDELSPELSHLPKPLS